MRRSRVAGFAEVWLAAWVLCACAAGPNDLARLTPHPLAGFWLGLWHGIICPVTFFVSLFTHSVNIYEVHNNGAWYNFGFVLGAGILFGGSHAGRGRRER